MPVRPEADTRDSSTSTERSASPGLTGSSHLSSSMPGEPKDSESFRDALTIKSMAIAQVCQPLAIRPFQRLAAARWAFKWNHWGS